MIRSSLRQRRRAVRTLRAAPAFLTEARVDRLIGMLDALRAPRTVITEYPEVSGTARKAPSVAESTAAPRASGSTSPHRLVEAAHSAPRPAPISSAVHIEPTAIVAPIASSTNADRILAALKAAADKEATIEAARDRARRDAFKVSVPHQARPVVRTIGVQNAAPAIAWLRSHGVSVKAASTTVFGTKYIASNEFGELDVAAIVALARRKGFAG